MKGDRKMPIDQLKKELNWAKMEITDTKTYRLIALSLQTIESLEAELKDAKKEKEIA